VEANRAQAAIRTFDFERMQLPANKPTILLIVARQNFIGLKLFD